LVEKGRDLFRKRGYKRNFFFRTKAKEPKQRDKRIIAPKIPPVKTTVFPFIVFLLESFSFLPGGM